MPVNSGIFLRFMRIMLSTVHAQKHNRQNFEHNRLGPSERHPDAVPGKPRKIKHSTHGPIHVI